MLENGQLTANIQHVQLLCTVIKKGNMSHLSSKDKY